MAQRKRRAKVQSATKTSANEIEKKLEEFQHELVQTSLFPEYGDGEMTLSEEQQRKNEQGKRLKSLKKAEDILDDILSEKKSSWVAVYTVLKNVQRSSSPTPRELVQESLAACAFIKAPPPRTPRRHTGV